MAVLSHERYSRRYRKWQQNVLLASPFVIFCGIVAAVFFFYRFVLVVAPIAFLEQTVLPGAGKSSIVCSEDETNSSDNGAPVLSAGYQKRIEEQLALSKNLVKNPKLSELDGESGEPAGYSHVADPPGAHYNLRKDKKDGAYLHVDVTKDTPKGGVSASWAFDSVKVRAGETYAYSFYYRSDVPVQVSVEYKTSGKVNYDEVTVLDPSASWQRFDAHFDNAVKAAEFRFDITSSAKGFVDSRGFDIHKIASATLPKGMVSVTFDDGWQSVSSEAAGLFAKYNIRTTQYIISNLPAQKIRGYMEYGTIRDMRREGHEIGSHSLNHCNQTLLDGQTLTINAVKSKEMLEKEKLGPISSFAYPLGAYNQKTQATYEKLYPFIRTSDFGYNDRYFDAANIRSAAIVDTTSNEELESWLEHAKKYKLWLVLAYHKVGEGGQYSVSQAQLERQLAAIKRSGLTSMPLSEAARSIRADR
ncbi:MAG TPA: polysaccharide deacetylase family protein [Candidatus Saccharimonadales bacterium]|nr:polysaccharide deacetylase family protein [Candidatus Saccharimonadales bacterium]